MEAEYTMTALGSLQEPQSIPRDEILVLVEKFISQLYQPGSCISQVKELRFHTCIYVQKKIRQNRIGFHQNKGHFMKQFSSPTIKLIVWNNGKVCCPSLPQPDGFDGSKGRINGSSL